MMGFKRALQQSRKENNYNFSNIGNILGKFYEYFWEMLIELENLRKSLKRIV